MFRPLNGTDGLQRITTLIIGDGPVEMTAILWIRKAGFIVAAIVLLKDLRHFCNIFAEIILIYVSLRRLVMNSFALELRGW